MKPFMWVYAGLAAAVAGAAIWVAFSHYVDFEPAAMAATVSAVLTGIMVGCIVAATAKERVGTMTGLGAIAMTLAGVMGGRYVATRMEFNYHAAESGWAEVSDELIISYIADTIAQEHLGTGKSIDRPTERKLGETATESDYPAGIWAEAAAQWGSADNAWRAQYREYVEYEVRQMVTEDANAVSERVPFEELDYFNFIIVAIAALMAGCIGSGSGFELVYGD
jgi:hypothetical protein